MRIAWIDPEPEDEADRERLAAIFEKLGVPGGAGLDHILRAHGPMPRTLDGHLALYRPIMKEPGPLSRAEREIVGVVVSARNECHY